MYDTAATVPSAVDQERLDHVILQTHQAMEIAERKCRKFKCGRTAWSPQLAEAQATVKYWAALQRKATGRPVRHKYLQHLRKMCPETAWAAAQITIAETSDGLAKARRFLRAATKQAESSRITFIQSLAQARAAANNTKAEAELLQMQNRESQRGMFRVIRHHMSGGRAATITEVVAPVEGAPALPWARHTDRGGIERAVLLQTNRHLRKAWHTPPHSDISRDSLGLTASLPGCEEVMSNTYTPPQGMDTYLIRILRQLHRPPGLTVAPAEVST